MTVFDTETKIDQSRPLSMKALLTAVSIALGTGIFTVDTALSTETGVAVLYVVVILLLADAWEGKGVLWVSFVCGVLSSVSFVATFGIDAEFFNGLRLCAALASIGMTTILVRRHHRTRTMLMEARNQALGSERRYRSIFDQSLISLWEQDYSQLMHRVEMLRKLGVTDISRYSREHPGFVEHCASLITTKVVNQATVDLLDAGCPEELNGSLGRFIPTSSATFVAVIQALLDGKPRFEGISRMHGPGGHVCHALLAIRFPEVSEEYDRVVIAMVDISERESSLAEIRKLQSELAAASRFAAVGAMSASIAHELNQPIAAMLMSAQTCLRWLSGPSRDVLAAAGAAERAVTEARRAGEIVKATKARLTNQNLTPENIDIDVLIRDTLSLLQDDLLRGGVAVGIDSSGVSCPVRAIRVELQQVLINLIMNSVQSLRQSGTNGGRIRVRVLGTRDGGLSVRISDNGPGFDGAVEKRLFTPLVSTKPNGMGMGLVICRKTVESFGGTIRAHNSQSGGAVVEFTLPCVDVQGIEDAVA
ncbi:sensor histidine kinase [Rhizobium mesosinicum]|uniref:histidine kinase n=1 Tax=Rhizobium mesosinicum TaxID=335017 RepID=A0ABS7GM11_9HYPH|nr:ATP-binding protein [Rhizobium mesosinicum]MBW9051034.1 two-component sensor histidine kinase [Rhizobium mesosinicum]